MSDQRIAFVNRLRSGERMSDLCREYGISRKTGYKFAERYKELAAAGLQDQSRAPRRVPHRTPESMVTLIRELRQQRPTWGPRKLKAVLERRHAGVRFPAASTIGEILVREKLVSPRRHRRRPTRLQADKLRRSERPNEVWCIDFKGQFRLGDRSLCYPLTVTDHYSRCYVGLEALRGTETAPVMEVMSRVFRANGLPDAIRSDNGVPFATRSLAGLSKLSVWWMKLGIVPERIEPGKPQQNGRHERSHLTLKQETARPAAHNALAQQERFDDWVERYNDERPHEAIAMKTPSELYRPSSRAMPDVVPEYSYAHCDDVRRVNRSGKVAWSRHHRFTVGAALAGEQVGIREIEPDRWQVDFLTMELGIYDARKRLFMPNPTPSYSPIY